MTSTSNSTNITTTTGQENTKWYVLRVVSGKEKKVKETLEKELQKSTWAGSIKQILLPTEKVYKVIKGKKITRERNFYPGYLMIEIFDGKFHDDLKDEIRNSVNVIHFLGKQNPTPLRKVEINKMLGKVDELSQTSSLMSEPFIVGETVKINDGPFNGFNASIEDVNDERKKIKVIVKIFGRSTPLELNFGQVEKIV